uniref:Uncharacterized protein n=1 Tax=Anguilla anguilla TaxID=7936 RepID=A0A0E9W1U5_ANGAN
MTFGWKCKSSPQQ